MTADALPAPAPAPALVHPGQKRFRSLARYAWTSFAWNIAANMLVGVFGAALSPAARSTASAICYGTFMVSGIVCGVVALFGIKKYGRKGILWPALVGICLWLLITGWSLWAIKKVSASAKALQARRAADPTTSTRLAPAVRHTDAKRVGDAELGFSFEVPDGYQTVDRSTLPSEYQMGFMQRPPDGPARLILISRMGGKPIPPQRLKPSDIPPALKGASLTAFHWRGLEIDGFRVSETKGDVHYITLNAQVPLSKEGVQLGVGGSEELEPLLRATVDQILSTFEGETNW